MCNESSSCRSSFSRVRWRAVRFAVAVPVLGGVIVLAPPVTATATTPSSEMVTTDASPSPPKFPLMPPALGSTTNTCTKPSQVHVNAVPWAQQSLNLTRAGRYSQGAGVTVGVVDTGVSPQAPLLAGRVQTIGDAAQDCVGHGTLLAGLIAASPAPGGGFSGMAPKARIIGARGTDALGNASVGQVAAGITAAVTAGAKVVVVSAALPRSSAVLNSAIASAKAHDVLLVAPAAPDSKPQKEDTSPAAYWPAAGDGVLSVVDIDIDGGRPQDDAPVPGRADLAAPGNGITGIGPSGTGYYVANGPSVAAALVAGTAALVRAQRPELSAVAVAARLRATAAHATVPLLDPAGALSMVLPTTGPAMPPDGGALHLPGTTVRSGVVHRAGLLAGLCLLLGLGAGAAMALAQVRASRRTPGRKPA